MNKKVLVFGKNGQVATALQELLSHMSIEEKNHYVFVSSQDCNLENGNAIVEVLNKYQPQVVINSAAYTKVDQAEKEESIAMQINANAPETMARWCLDHKALFVHYSTDYVFDGTGEFPWHEVDSTHPINAYGRTKCEGEKKIKAIGGDYIIFRTSWVYYQKGQNFLLTMLRLGQEKEVLKIVSDQIGAPTYAGDIAEITLKVVGDYFDRILYPSGVYNLANAGETSWYGFAQEIFAQARKYNRPLKIKDLVPIPSTEYPTPAKRPLNSRLSADKLFKTMSVKMPHWKSSLEACMEKVYGS